MAVAGQEVNHRQEDMQQRRHHRSQQAGDAVGRVEQAVDRLLLGAVGNQGRGWSDCSAGENTMRRHESPTDEIMSRVIETLKK